MILPFIDKPVDWKEKYVSTFKSKHQGKPESKDQPQLWMGPFSWWIQLKYSVGWIYSSPYCLCTAISADRIKRESVMDAAHRVNAKLEKNPTLFSAHSTSTIHPPFSLIPFYTKVVMRKCISRHVVHRFLYVKALCTHQISAINFTPLRWHHELQPHRQAILAADRLTWKRVGIPLIKGCNTLNAKVKQWIGWE